MAKIKLTVDLLEGILARIPEGFITRKKLAARIQFPNHKHSHETPTRDIVAACEHVESYKDYYYDSSRLSVEQVKEYSQWCQPTLPGMTGDGNPLGITISQALETHTLSLQSVDNPAMSSVLETMKQAPGYLRLSDLTLSTEHEMALQNLLSMNILREYDSLIYDPLRLSLSTIKDVAHQNKLNPLREKLTNILQKKPGQTASRPELLETFSSSELQDVLSAGGFSTFVIKMKVAPYQSHWVRLKGSDQKAARKIAEDAVRIKDEFWQDARELCGDRLRSGARDGKSLRSQVIARSYTKSKAAKRLGIRSNTLKAAIQNGLVTIFIDPEEQERIPAQEIEEALDGVDVREEITSFETLKVREISIVCGVSYSTAHRRLKRARIKATQPQWGQIRGRWNLPDTLHEFYDILHQKKEDRRIAREAARAEEQRLIWEEQEAEMERRRVLRERLVAAFPTWQHDWRVDQRISLHIGPPNSGKTHEALDTLVAAGRGWYLAPLRLLAFEIYDRLNQRGVFCNLLTGEERVDIPGATITAATIEMFNSQNSGECIIIDEAQMLADPDRGWAWTRALMEAQAPEIHVIAPPTAQVLIEQLARAAAIPLTVIGHQRLTPIRVADTHWRLENIPSHTILVAFSRKMVLQLKSELEKAGRSVSVVYGALPPEVRRKQADRFANGETEICVSTDAVGMGLNLPADYVCFYELEKFDGRNIRTLTPTEVHQIGGRAGRYGLSKAGEIGTTTKQNLRLLRRVYEQVPETLTHARVAPTVADLELIPGNLAEQLIQWGMLQSIPDTLRNVIKTADLDERIELAKRLTDEEVDRLGLATALKLVNAPTRQSSRPYWLDCAHAILANDPMPLPSEPPQTIRNSTDLELIEHCITCADIYLWLSHRPEFGHCAPDEADVRSRRASWSDRIDEALLKKLDLIRRCKECGVPLSIHYRYAICSDCFGERTYRRRS